MKTNTRTFLNWTGAGIVVSTSADYSFVADGTKTLSANCSYPNYTYFINGVVSPASSGTVVISNTAGLSGASYNGGTLITLTATPGSGYYFAYWRQGAGLGDLSGPPHVVSTNRVLRHMVCYGTTLTAVFEPSFPVLTLTPSPVAGGTVTGAGAFTNGTTVTVNAAPAVGYAFASWRKASTEMSVEANYTFPLTTHTALTAIFVATTNTIAAAAAPSEGGSVTGAGAFGHGATITLTAIQAPGFTFTNWTLGGATAGTNNPVTFNALGDYEFVANFVGASQPAASPQLAFVASTPGVPILQWRTNSAGFALEQNSDLTSTNWVTFASPTTIVDTNYQATIPTQTGSDFFRLAKP